MTEQLEGRLDAEILEIGSRDFFMKYGVEPAVLSAIAGGVLALLVRESFGECALNLNQTLMETVKYVGTSASISAGITSLCGFIYGANKYHKNS